MHRQFENSFIQANFVCLQTILCLMNSWKKRKKNSPRLPSKEEFFFRKVQNKKKIQNMGIKSNLVNFLVFFENLYQQQDHHGTNDDDDNVFFWPLNFYFYLAFSFLTKMILDLVIWNIAQWKTITRQKNWFSVNKQQTNTGITCVNISNLSSNKYYSALRWSNFFPLLL